MRKKLSTGYDVGSFFMKKFRSIDEQIGILKERGLSIPDQDKAYNYLLTNNYYNIINGYSKYFQEIENRYIKGTSFDEIFRLYFFDKEFKQILLNAILAAEHHLKSIVAYRFAEEYPNKKYAYLDTSCYDTTKILNIGFNISKISKIINNNKKIDNNAIYHYYKKHHDVPIWVIVDFLDFGALMGIILNIPVTLQNKIAKDLTRFIRDNNPNFNSVFSPETMCSFIKGIHEIRNVCAHNNKLLDFKTRSDLKYFEELHSKYKILKNRERRSVYDIFIVLQCFLSHTEYAILHNTMLKRFKNLSNKLNTLEVSSILTCLGFPEDWIKVEKLSQSSHCQAQVQTKTQNTIMCSTESFGNSIEH